jgi:hypothetical protein
VVSSWVALNKTKTTVSDILVGREVKAPYQIGGAHVQIQLITCRVCQEFLGRLCLPNSDG